MRTRRFQFSSNPVSSPQGDANDSPVPSKAYVTEGKHQPVLLHEAIAGLAIEKDDVVVDATLGGAGHARALTDALGKKGTFIGFDLDHDAILRARQALANITPKTHLIEANFRNLTSELAKIEITHIDKVLFDLGWSSFQLTGGRGFSLKSDEPLQMTFTKDPKSGLTAGKIVNEWAEESLADIIYGWGEERYSRRIAKAIVERRAQKPFMTARELAEVIYAVVPPRYRHGRIHPATRTFQALRIAVNDELGALQTGLGAAWSILSPRGRIAVITFHSIEDRLVKQTFKQWEERGEGTRITRKPIVASDEETAKNPRSRSAKLRIISKI